MEHFRLPTNDTYGTRYDKLGIPVLEAFIQAHEDLLERGELDPFYEAEAKLSLMALRAELASRREP